MFRQVLRQDFARGIANFGYFNTNYFTLKHLLLAVLLLPSLLSSGQGYNNIEFIENKGQWDERIRFKGNVSNGNFFIREQGFTVVQHHPSDFAMLARFLHGHNEQGKPVKPSDKFVLRSHAWHVDFVGASKNIQAVPDKMVPTYNNYFIGNNPEKWSSDCKIYQAITLKDVYPNIDVRYYTDNEFLKYDIIVKPGGDISKIALRYDGVDQLQVRNRELLIGTSIGELKESSPYTYQATANGKNEIGCKYNVKDKTVRFDVKNYDRNATLIIDPAIVFCSFSGSSADNWGFTATYGPDGSMFGGGIVLDGGGSFPASPGAFQTTFQGGFANGASGAIDIGIIKLSPDGRNRVYATYIGGSGNEQPHSLVVNSQGNLVIAGRSNSDNYPKTGANGQIGPGGGFDIVVTMLNAAGTALVGSKKIGGQDFDGVNITEARSLFSLQRNYGDDGRTEVILDGAGNVYVASTTQSVTDFPTTPGVFQPTSGGNQDGVLLKFNANVSALSFASYLGGDENDAAYVLALAPTGDIYVAGGTESSDLPGNTAGTVGPANHGGIDGFVSVISNNGSAITRTTYIGTSAIDQVFGIQFDLLGYPYIMGQTTGTWPIINAAYNNPAGKQFIAKLEDDLSSYIYSTAFGSGASTPNISPIAFLVDRCENVYISGWGGYFFGSNDFGTAGTNGLPVTPDALKSTTDGLDMYFFVLKKNATEQLYGSFFGENNPSNAGSDHVDGGTSRFDANGVIYQAICGNCKLGFPTLPYPVTAGAWSTTNNSSNCNLTMVKIAMNLAGVNGGIQSAIDGSPRDTAGCVPLTVDFRDTIGTAQSYEWHFNYIPGNPPDQITTTPNASHIYTATGTYQVMLVAVDPNTCNVRDSSYLTIRVGDLIALPAFTPVKLPPCTEFRYRFDNTSVPPPSRPFGPTSFVWDFGDGSPRITAGAGPVFHNYAGPGTYNVKLILQDLGYCNAPDSITRPLAVATNVVARFTTPASSCFPYTAEFRNTSDAGETWLWNFGDPASGADNTSTAFEPTHTFSGPGTYNVVLIAFNPNTCNLSDTTAAFTVTVYGAPVPDFNYTPVVPVANTATTFSNLSSPDAVRFRWEFGDGDTLLTTSRAPVVHQYNATGSYNACLTAYNIIGCDSTICKQVDIVIIPVVDVPSAFTPLSGDDNSVVYARGFGIAKMQFTIWNRWGQKMFETNNRFQGWDGRFKGAVQPMDVYVYTLNVEFSDGTKTTKKGDITLIR